MQYQKLAKKKKLWTMESNRDEAIRAKEIAERKFILNDIEGANKFALKAQKLFPTLDGINQMIATLGVHLSSTAQFDGEKDWYTILGVNPRADDEAVKKQYRKLALVLHPDKNRSVGAEGAFQLVSEACSVLSDKTKRMLYDHRRFGKKDYRSLPDVSNCFYKFVPEVQTQKRDKGSSFSWKLTPPSSERKSKSGTFWTKCDKCNIQYEYLRAYLNHNILCPTCHVPFVALENVDPSTWPKPSVQKFSQKQNTEINYTVKNANINGRCTTPGVGSKAALLQRSGSGLKRNSSVDGGNEHSFPMVGKLRKRRRGVARDNIKASSNDGEETGNNAAMHPNNSSMSSLTSRNFSIQKDFPKVHVLNTLVKKSKGELHKTIKAWSSAKEAKFTAEKMEKTEKQKLKGSVKENVKRNVCENIAVEDRGDKRRKFNVQAPPSPKEASNSETTDSDDEEVSEEPASMDVTDPDFHDFDKERIERSFQGDEVWAIYDNADVMPRHYAMVQKVISYKPFKVRMGFLNSKSNSEYGLLNWVTSGFSKTSGSFRVGRYGVCSLLNIFSHRVRWEKVRGAFKILPRKGEIWALYRNWSPDWSVHTPDDVIYKYDMVEVLEDYDEEQGLCVIAPLVKVAGFKTVFNRDTDPNKVNRIPREEMFRFSHQVPSYVLTGEEGSNAPKGCYELDPAATPLELLQIITETKDEGVLKASE